MVNMDEIFVRNQERLEHIDRFAEMISENEKPRPLFWTWFFYNYNSVIY